MFTGLIEGQGSVVALGGPHRGKAEGTQRLRVRAAFALGKLPLGASMAVIMLVIAATIVLLSTWLARRVSDRGGRAS